MSFLPDSPTFEVIGACICCGCSYLFYRALHSQLLQIDAMQATPILRHASIVNQSGQVMMAGTTGFLQGTVEPVHGEGIGPVGSTTNTAAKDGVKGVFAKKTITEIIVTQLFGIWSHKDQELNVEFEAVPFHIIDGNLKILVQNPLELESVDLQMVGESFEVPQQSFFTTMMSLMKGYHTTGIKNTHEMLLSGTEVVGLGRLVLKSSGFYLERDPSVPYLVASRTKEQIIQDYESWVPFFRIGCWLTGFTAALFIASRRAWTRWRQTANRRSHQQAMSAAEDCDPDELPAKLSCITCCGLRNAALVPCAHVAVCLNCVDKLHHCPVCRSHISSVQPLIFS